MGVIGVTSPYFGEEAKAIIQPKKWVNAGAGLEAELREWVRERISRLNWTRSYKFVEDLPRLGSGKLVKHELRKVDGNPVPVI